MPNYRRNRVPDGTYFFTVNLLERQRRNERGIWQRRYWEHTIRNDLDYERHMDYLHFNPVKHGYVAGVKDWPYSSFRRLLERGLYSLDWCSCADDFEIGEPG